jgi:hypothetical protein
MRQQGRHCQIAAATGARAIRFSRMNGAGFSVD